MINHKFYSIICDYCGKIDRRSFKKYSLSQSLLHTELFKKTLKEACLTCQQKINNEEYKNHICL